MSVIGAGFHPVITAASLLGLLRNCSYKKQLNCRFDGAVFTTPNQVLSAGHGCQRALRHRVEDDDIYMQVSSLSHNCFFSRENHESGYS